MSQSVFHAHYWRDCARLTTQKLCVMGVLMALQIILSRITAINLGNWLRISFGFLPNAIAGYLRPHRRHARRVGERRPRHHPHRAGD